jgi:DNA-binding NtrC family response regulator
MNILIADDNSSLRKVMVNELAEEGFNIREAEDGLKALEILESNDYDVLLLDLNMPLLGGMEVLKKIQSLHISVEVIILTGHGTVAVAVEAMKCGAYDFLTKPFNISELKAVIAKAYEKKKILNENLLLRTQLRRHSEAERIISRSALMAEILNTVRKVALSNMPVLIHGESGTGKELVARAVHENSHRHDGPFIPINCGAIPENMLESELFGYEKGAFTGAVSRKPGLLELAHNGTLFLDEIGELNQSLQIKLLRIIETGRFFRVGGTREIQVSVRYVAATNKDIKAEVDKGCFRPDLYYRISALTIHLPPLRERKEDIPLLIEHFRNNNPSFRHKKFSDGAVRILMDYPWPGNVRELQNVVHRTILLSQQEIIGPADLPADLTAGHAASRRLDDVEKEYILRILNEAGGHKGKAAEILGINPKTLYRKLVSYGVKE